jgi:propanol-preferring alcohol dehydrogenase
MLVDSPRQLAPLGDLDPVLAAPLTDAAVTPYRAIKRSQRVLGPGSVVTVIGIGGLGHLAVQILRAMAPSTVIAVDSRPDALSHATSLGAHHAVPAGEGAAQAIQDLTQGRGADLTLDLVGNETTMALAMATTRSAGRIMLVGVAGGAVPWSFWATKFEVELSVSTWGSISDLREVIALARSGLIAPTVTTYGFDEIPAAFEALESGTLEGRAVILPNG